MFNPFAKTTATQNKTRGFSSIINVIRRRPILFIAALGGFIIILSVYYIITRHDIKYNPGKARMFGAPISVEVYKIREEPIVEVIGATAEIRPFTDVNIVSHLQIKVNKVNVDVGDLVKRGQVLIELDQSVVVPALKAAENRVQKAKAELEKVEKTKITYHQELLSALESAEAQLKAAESNLEKNQTNFNRIKSLYEDGFVSKSDFDAAKSLYDQAIQARSQAKENLIKSQNALDNEEVTVKSWLAGAQYNYSSALESLAQTMYDSENSIIASPVDGIVTERNVNPGEIIIRRFAEISKLLTVAQINPILVAGQVPQEKINSVHLGQTAYAILDAEPNKEFTGTVFKIEPKIDEETKTFAALIKVDNPEYRLKPGMTAFVRIYNEHHGVAVPRIAVIDAAGKTIVVTVDSNNIAHIKKIEVGILDEKNYQVLSGLQPNELVVIVGQMDLKEGDKVRILRR